MTQPLKSSLYSSNPPRILIIDDTEANRELIADYIDLLGYSSLQASNGKEGLEVMLREKPELVLLDMMMPVLNGADFLRCIKGMPDLATIPVVVMSGDTAARQTAQSLGAVGCLPKPVEIERLLEVAHKYVPA